MLDLKRNLPANQEAKPKIELGDLPKFTVKPPQPKKDLKKTIFTTLGLLSFVIVGLAGVLISQKQYFDSSIKAPNAPASNPAAYINQASCHLSFTVPGTTTKANCGFGPCETAADCQDGLSCITAENGNSYCSQPAYEEACALEPGQAACCNAPTATPEPGVCGSSSCTSNSDCESGLTCITASNSEKYCAKPAYEDNCADNPSIGSCCNAPTPTNTPTPTSTSQNGSSSSSSSSSSSNSTVVVNIKNDTIVSGNTSNTGTNKTTAATTKAPTKTPTKTTTKGQQPDYPQELPKTGPEDWLTYLQIGLGTLGVGALLILFL